MLGLFVIGGLFLYAFPLRVATSWPKEPLRIAHIHPISFQLADYLISAALDAMGQVKLAAAGQWEVTPKDSDRELLSETFQPGDVVRMEKDADNWRGGSVSGASYLDAADTTPAYFVVALTATTTAGTLAVGDTVTIESVR